MARATTRNPNFHMSPWLSPGPGFEFHGTALEEKQAGSPNGLQSAFVHDVREGRTWTPQFSNHGLHQTGRPASLPVSLEPNSLVQGGLLPDVGQNPKAESGPFCAKKCTSRGHLWTVAALCQFLSYPSLFSSIKVMGLGIPIALGGAGGGEGFFPCSLIVGFSESIWVTTLGYRKMV